MSHPLSESDALESGGAKPDAALVQEIAREHASVREAVSELRGEIERLRGEPGPSHAPGRLGGMLSMFRFHLARHFSLEEQGRFLGDATDRSATAERAVTALLADHRRFEHSLNSLLDATQRAESGTAGLTDEFAEALNGFLEELETHEREENQLAQELVNRDAGGAG